MSKVQKFRDDVEAFLAASGVKATTLGKAALGDPSFVFQLRRGRVPNLDIVDRVESFMRDHEQKAETRSGTSAAPSEPERAA